MSINTFVPEISVLNTFRILNSEIFRSNETLHLKLNKIHQMIRPYMVDVSIEIGLAAYVIMRVASVFPLEARPNDRLEAL